MRIGIDVRYLSHGLLGGVHTYVYNFVSELARLDSSDEFYLYADTKRPFELDDLPPNFKLRLLPWRSKLDTVRSDFLLGRLAARDQLDVFHLPANYGFGPPGIPSVITLHDALNVFPLWEAVKRDLKRPKTVGLTLYLQLLTRLTVRRAARVITVSNFSADNISEISQGKIAQNRIKVIYSAASAQFRPLPDPAVLAHARARLDLPPSFVLADGLKNPGVILRAWERLPASLRADTQLIFFSRRANLLPVAEQAIARGQARLLLRPGEDDLIALYNLARIFLFPSWIEGFGLPILEAMACGAPVIASDRSAIPEIGGEAALYHDAEDDATLARYIERLLTSPAESARRRASGFEQARRFSWSRTAQEILSTYHEVARPGAVRLASVQEYGG